MRVLVTGGAGKVGRAVVERLTQAGYQVTVTGRSPRDEAHGARYARSDTTDMASLLPLVREADAIVHLAAIPAPGRFPQEEIFRNNCCGTFNVFEAAARAGIRRVVCASSINAVGFNWGTRAFPIPYLPIDERMPGFATDVYSFSKQLTEGIAEYAWRRDGISSVCLRFPWVAPAVNSTREVVTAHAARCRASQEALMALPDQERMRRAAAWVAHRDTFRVGRQVEAIQRGRAYESPDPLVFGRTDFWTRIDERDSAQAVEKSLAAELEGCHTLFVNDSHNITGVPSATLAQLFFPEAQARAEKLTGTSTMVSIDAARKLIGFEPEFSVGRWL